MISLERTLMMILFAVFIVNVAKASETFIERTSPGRPAHGLKIKKSKVPTFEIFSAKGKIPRIDVGEEAEFRTSALPKKPEGPPALSMKPIEKRQALPVVEFDLKKTILTPANSDKNVVGHGTAVPALKTYDQIADPATKESSVDAKRTKDFSPSESHLLEAQILLEKHDNPGTALGLLVELLNDKDKSIQLESRFTYALAARKLDLASEYRATMMKIMIENKENEWGRLATESLVREVETLEIPDMKVLQAEVQRHDVPTDGNDAYNFYLAKYQLENGDLTQVEEALKQIPEKSKYRIDALLVAALSAYRSGNVAFAETQLEMMLQESDKENSLRSIGALTLARIRFQLGEYKEASKAYLEVDKSNALWLQAMTEQAWTQILLKDYEGAAGNMFSLHTDFFKNAFAPESYAARSVAYLNLCQYGDGLQTIGNFKHKYGPLVARIEKYRSEKKAPQDDYDTVRTWLKNSELKEVNGLPRSFIVELARHPSFMRTQNQINHFEDELDRFGTATVGLLQFEKDLIRRQNDLRDEFQKLKVAKEDRKEISADKKLRMDEIERNLSSLKIRYELAKKARGFIKDARTRAMTRIDAEKVVLKQNASKALRQRLESLRADLTQVLEQNEVLQYEILAGAGEHLRAQSAGADLGSKKQEAVKPSDKSMKWSFQGEIWEDEVGHYRSSLKNVCPKDDQVASY